MDSIAVLDISVQIATCLISGSNFHVGALTVVQVMHQQESGQAILTWIQLAQCPETHFFPIFE